MKKEPATVVPVKESETKLDEVLKAKIETKKTMLKETYLSSLPSEFIGRNLDSVLNKVLSKNPDLINNDAKVSVSKSILNSTMLTRTASAEQTNTKKKRR